MMNPSGAEALPPSKFQEAMRELLEHISEEQLLRFHPTKGALHLWHNPALHKTFPVVPDKVGKNAEKSATYRQLGNNLFQKKKFDEALEMFNISVMFAPFPQESNDGTSSSEASVNQPKTNGECISDDVVENGEPTTNGNVDQVDSVENPAETNPTNSDPEKTAQKGNKKKRNKKRKPRNYKGKSGDNSTHEVQNGKEDMGPVGQQEIGQGQGQHEGQRSESDDPKGNVEQNGSAINGNGILETKSKQNEQKAKVEKPRRGDNNVDETHAMSYVLANRSASLFFLHLYKECVADIDLAFKLGYPDELAYKLHERKAKCLVQLGQSQEAIEFFQKATMSVADAHLDEKGKQNAIFAFGKQIKQLKDGKMKTKPTKCEIKFIGDNIPPLRAERSPKFGCTSTAFKMAVNDTRGRHVMAEEDIAVAEMVSCEDPYSSVLYAEYHTTHCNRCLCRVIVATPCRQCSNVMYCSATCEEKAWDLYHQVECPVLSWLHPTWLGRLGHLALRTVLVAGYTNLKTYFCNDSESAKLKRMSAFNTDGTYSTGYNSVYHLVANVESRSPENIFNFSLIAVFLMKVFFTGVACLFRNNGVMSGDFFTKADTPPSGEGKQNAAPSGGQGVESASGGPSEKQLEILSLALTHHLQIIQCNGFAIPEMQGKDDFRTYVPRDVGVGLYAVHGLLNHSCDPDLDLCFFGHTMVARAIKGITKGNEICVDYGVLYFTQPKEVRQATLTQQYYFECKCNACVGDWPLWQDIECVTPTFRCGSCRAPLPSVKSMSPLPSHIICMCGHETAVLQNLSQLNESHQRYAIAMKLKGESSNDSILLALIEHLSLMDKFICPPWRDYVSCQSSVKQSFRLMGNWFRVRGEIPPPE